MLLEELFEKRERSMWVLITTLMNQPGKLSLKNAMVHTELSKVTLLKYIEELNELASSNHMTLEVIMKDEYLELNLGHHETKQDIVQLFLPYSLKYQILTYLYNNEDYTVQKLSQELLISEATFHRQLVGLNNLLEEFDLAIKSGRLRGPEHQIRYFYFMLYWLTEPRKEVAELSNSQQVKNIIHTFQQYWGSNTLAESELLIGLWIRITRQRLTGKDKDFTVLKKLMKPYYSHRFYQQIRQQTLLFLSRYALESEEEEVMSQFMFLTTMSILPPYVMERNLGYGGPISDATTKGLQYIRSTVSRHENLNEQGMYTLNQVLGQLYFFKGLIIDTTYNASDLSLIKSGMNVENADLAASLIDDVINNVYDARISDLGDAYTKVKWTLTEVLSYVVYQTPKNIMIGLDIQGDETEKLPMLTVIRQRLEVNRLVSVELYNSHLSFDFVISNAYDKEYPVPYYLLKGLPNYFDIRQLEKIVHELLYEAN